MHTRQRTLWLKKFKIAEKERVAQRKYIKKLRKEMAEMYDSASTDQPDIFRFSWFMEPRQYCPPISFMILRS
jgi:hypothetical protein